MSIRQIPYIARPLGLHYTHFVSPSDLIAYLLAVVEKYSNLLNHMVYFVHILHIHILVNIPEPLAYKTNHIFGGRGFAEHQSSLWWSISENLHNSRTLWDI